MVGVRAHFSSRDVTKACITVHVAAGRMAHDEFINEVEAW
jgi:hypothetical protein